MHTARARAASVSSNSGLQSQASLLLILFFLPQMIPNMLFLQEIML